MDESSITITVPITVIGGNSKQIATWHRGIDAAWNRGNDGDLFEVCGRRVVFNPEFVLHAPPLALSSTSHIIVVEPVKPGQTYVSRVWHALGTSPTYSARTGFWGSNSDAGTAAHEFGHLLGLFDEYVENDRNSNGHREPGEMPVPDLARFRDASFSMMAIESGSVLQRHVREVLRMHGAVDLLTCG